MTLWKFLTEKRKRLQCLNTFCKFLHPCYCFFYWAIPNNILLFLAGQINLILFYYLENVYQKNHLRTGLDKRIKGYDTGGRVDEVGSLLLCNNKNNVLCSQSSVNYSNNNHTPTAYLTLTLCCDTFCHIAEGHVH